MQRATSQRLAASSLSSPPPVPASPPEDSLASGSHQREARASAVDENGQLNLRALAASGKVKRWEEVWTSSSPTSGSPAGGPSGEEVDGEAFNGVRNPSSSSSASSSGPAIIPYSKLRALIHEASLAAARRVAAANSSSEDSADAAAASADASSLQLSAQLLAAGVRDLELFSSFPEAHLSDADLSQFLEVAGGKKEWESLPLWKQKALRKKAKLTINVQAMASPPQQQMASS
jgi:hypothetical protein